MTACPSFRHLRTIPSRSLICTLSSNYTTLQMYIKVPSFFLLLRHSSSFIDYVLSVAASSDNKFIVSGSKDKSIKVFDLQTKEQLHHFAAAHISTFNLISTRYLSSFIEAVFSVAVSSDSRFVVSGSEDKSIKVFDLQTKQQLHHIPNAHQRTIIFTSASTIHPL